MPSANSNDRCVGSRLAAFSCSKQPLVGLSLLCLTLRYLRTLLDMPCTVSDNIESDDKKRNKYKTNSMKIRVF